MSTSVLTLTLGQFRSYEHAVIETGGRSVALIGRNGAGKTNVLEAASMLSPGRGLRRVGAADLARRPPGTMWKVAAHLRCADRDHDVETLYQGGATRSVRIDDKAAPQIALGRIARMVWLTPAMDRLWTEGSEGRRRFLDRVAMSFEPSHAEAVLSYEKAMRERNRLLKDHVRDDAWFAALERAMAAAGFAIMRNRRAAVDALGAAQALTMTAFPTATLVLADPGDDTDTSVTDSAEALGAALADGRGRDMQAGRTLVGPHRTDLEVCYAAKGMAARLCSTGEQKALLLSLVLANARALALDHGAPPVLLLDEVAAHLDPARRSALYAEIAALGCQAWMTGTEPGLFSDLGDALRLRVTEADGASRLEAF